MKSEDFRDLQEYIHSIISIDNSLQPETDLRDLQLKLDILERLIQIVRASIDHYQNDLPLAEILKFERKYIGKHLIISKLLERPYPEVSYRRPEDLEAPLLLYLLLNYNKQEQVLDLINNFIREIKTTLTPFDFEKTSTGVIRCFTNTRFAAKRLRDFGLLLFTDKEAFRTWKLSFMGVITAGLFYTPGWRVNIFQIAKADTPYPPLWWRLWETVQSLSKDINVLIESVKFLCHKGNIKQELKKQTLDAIHSLYPIIKSHAQQMQSKELSEKQRVKVSQAFLSEIIKLPVIQHFMNELNLSFEKKEFLSIVEEIYRSKKAF